MIHNNPYEMRVEVVHQAEPAHVQTVREIRERMHVTVRKYVNRCVRIQTVDGCIVEGVIVHVDGGMLYLSVSPSHSMRGNQRQFFNPVILPLVLYELLVISLL